MTRITDPTTDELYQAARELAGSDLLPKLKALLPEDAATLEAQLGATTRHAAAPAPWNDPAAGLFFEIHADARRYEALLSLRLFHRATYRPPADRHTVAAIRRLPVLLDHAHAVGLGEADTLDPTRALLGWPVRIRRMLDEARPGEEPRRRVPGDPTCPHCSGLLYLSPGWRALEANATAYCPSCRDDDGRRLTWPLTERIGRLQTTELVSIPLAARRYGIKPSRMWQWRHRGRLHPYGADEHGRDLFRVADILALAQFPAHVA